MDRRNIAVAAIALALLGAFVISSVLYEKKEAEKLERAVSELPSALVRASAKTLGPMDARVHIVEFLDPGCETCREFHPFVKQLVESGRGKVKVSIRYLPLHDGADTMVKILEAAGRQGKYWETLHLMFAAQPHWASHHHPQPEKIWPLLPRSGSTSR
jgi:protein-disulfide isomerase